MTGVAALVLAALFTGAALYIVVAEHPARAQLGPAAQLTQWRSAYARGTMMQAPLALAGGLLGLWLGLTRDQVTWTTGGIVMLGAIGWTFAAMWRLNNRIKGTVDATAETAAQLRAWGRLHAIRTLFGAGATILYALALTIVRP